MAAVGTNYYFNVITFSPIRELFISREMFWFGPRSKRRHRISHRIGKNYSKRLASTPDTVGSQLKNVSSPYIHTIRYRTIFLIMDIRLIIVLIVFFFFFFIHTTHVLRYHYFFFFSLSKLYMYVHILDAGTKELVRLYSIQFPFIRLSRSHERFCAKKGNKMAYRKWKLMFVLKSKKKKINQDNLTII